MSLLRPCTLPAPDAWARQAAGLPLAFAQVREDPRLDLELASILPYEGTVVMIASGGDTAICMGWVPLKRLLLVDMNPAQLALTHLKWELAQTRTSREALELLGHLPMDPESRLRDLHELCDHLNLSPQTLGPEDTLAKLGPDQAGRYEATFAELRRELSPFDEPLSRLLNSRDVREASAMAEPCTELGCALDAAFASVMSLQNLVCLFGPEATQNPRQPFHLHFAERTRQALRNFPAWTNPFLWQILRETFPHEVYYDWMQHCTGQPTARTQPEYAAGRMKDVLDSLDPESVDLLHLSNILDWLSVEDATATLSAAHRVLKKQGRVILRQLNSTLDIPALESGLTWDTALGADMTRRDRSYFYPEIHVGRKG